MSVTKIAQEPSVSPSDNILIAVIHGNGFTRGCITHTLAAEFGSDHVLGLRSLYDIDRVKRSRLSLIILVSGDRSLDDGQLLAEIEALRKAAPGVPLVLLSDDCSMTAAEAKAHGIRGVISSADTLEIGVAALRLIIAGGCYYAQPAERALSAEDWSQRAPVRALCQTQLGESPAIAPDLPATELLNGRPPSLTEREAQVLAWLQKGLPNKAIANQLHLSENTVKVHVRRIMRKLNARNRTEVVLLSQRLAPNGAGGQAITGRLASGLDSVPVSAGNPTGHG